MNQPKQRRHSIAWFDARSVMLFAALAVGGVTAQAQTAPAQTSRPAQSGARQEIIGGSVPAPASKAPAQQQSQTPATSSTAPATSTQTPQPATGLAPRRGTQHDIDSGKNRSKNQ